MTTSKGDDNFEKPPEDLSQVAKSQIQIAKKFGTILKSDKDNFGKFVPSKESSREKSDGDEEDDDDHD